jgi:hypothetical protein
MNNYRLLVFCLSIFFADILLAQKDTVIFNPQKEEYEIKYWTQVNDTNKYMTVIFIPATKIKPSVNCRLKKVGDKFEYHYKISNSNESKRAIVWFFLQIRKDLIAGIKKPKNWLGRSGGRWMPDSFSWVNDETELYPSQSRDSLIIISKALPAPRNSYFQGPTPMYQLTEEETSDFLYRKLDSLDRFPLNFVSRKTIVPISISSTISNINFLDTLIFYNNISQTQNWIKAQAIAGKYNNYFLTAKTALQQNNYSIARTNLQNILRDVDSDSVSTITSEAYALLRFNTEYLLSKIPQDNLTLTSLSPAITTTKTKEFELTVFGNGFTTTSVIYFNNAVQKTTFISSAQLKTLIGKKDFQKEGKYTVYVKNDDGKTSANGYVNIYKNLPADVIPILNCIETITQNKYKAWFGYDNKNSGTVWLEQESENKFNPAPLDRGQPKLFQAGKQNKVFSIEFEKNNKLMWTLGSGKAEANNNSPLCK